MYNTRSFNPQIMRLVGQLLIAFADAEEHTPQAMPMPGMPGSGADGFPAEPMPPMPPFVAEMLRGMGVPVPGMGDEQGLYGDEDHQEGGPYVPTPEGGHAMVDEDTITPQAFDPHDLPLEKYEDCSEKTRQTEDPDRRVVFRDDPQQWMETAIYYAHQMVDTNCDAEEAVRCFLCLPGGSALRRRKVAGDKTELYDTAWIEAQNHIQVAYDSDRIDPTDFQAVMVLLGDPFHPGTTFKADESLTKLRDAAESGA